MQFKTVTRLNARNEWTLLGIGGYDINRLNTDLKNPDDHQKYLLDWVAGKPAMELYFGNDL